jgi:hypothetical protein
MEEAYGFFDESGCHDSARILVVAGWVATLDEWEKFEKQWKLALKRAGLRTFILPTSITIAESLKVGVLDAKETS